MSIFRSVGRRLGVAVVFFVAIVEAMAQEVPDRRPAWMLYWRPPLERAMALVAAMTLDEKIEQIALHTGPNPGLPGCGERRDTRHIEGIPRLGIPTVRLTNGPIGVAGGDCEPNPVTTALPTALLVAATWDRKAAAQWGEIAGVETKDIAHQVLLGPGVNLARLPQAGRNFEYFGEDPFLSGAMAVAEIRAIQAQGTQATIKHFIANEQETDRATMNTIVDDRTLHELYLLPFEMAIQDASPAAVMCSYPKVLGVFSCESPRLLYDVLRGELGFNGYVMSDRKATHSTAKAIKAGLDLEFDSTAVWFTAERIKADLAAGRIATTDLDEMLKRRYYTMFRLGQFDHPAESFTPIDLNAHAAAARGIAEEGAVLLKNQNELLPLNARKLKSVAIIGAATFAGRAKLPATGPKGMVSVSAPFTVTPAEGMKNALELYVSHATVTYDDGTDLLRAKALAARSEVAIVMAGDISLEGEDRANLDLPSIDGVDQNGLIAGVASANPRTIVVLKDGGPVLMPWLSQAAAVLEAWYPGQEDGIAVANLLLGNATPSGKLPITFPRLERDGPVKGPDQYPGVMVGGVRTVTYSEGFEIGYRWYDAHGVAPQFPFGFGLSYTTFSFSKLLVTKQTDGVQPVTVSFTVVNTGIRDGTEVAQVYLGLPAGAGEPPKRLVAFQRVELAARQKKRVEIVIDPAASSHPFGFWDSENQKWDIQGGVYRIYVGNSSANAALRDAITVRR
jgi:beta-glucosidase